MPSKSKPIRETDKDYLEYIRNEPGLVEGDDIVAHHTVSVGAGGSDYLAVPLPFKHHTPGVHSMGKATFQKEYNINFDKEIIRLLIKYIKKLKQEYPDKWFKRGQNSIKRKNKSGCCCIIDDSDNVVSVCGAHANWLDEYKDAAKIRKTIETALSDSESWGPGEAIK